MPLVFRNVREKKEQIQINLSEKNLYDQKIQIFLDQQQLNQDYFHNLMKQIKTYSNFYLQALQKQSLGQYKTKLHKYKTWMFHT